MGGFIEHTGTMNGAKLSTNVHFVFQNIGKLIYFLAELVLFTLTLY